MSQTNKIIANIKKTNITADSFVNSQNVICIDTSFNRIGINTKNPRYSIDISGDSSLNTIYSNNLIIVIIDTGIKTQTGGRILKCQNLFKKDEIFLLTYGDGISSINIRNNIKIYKKSNKIGLVSAVRPPARFGKLKIKNDIVEKFEEKNQTDEGWINGGFFVLNEKIFKFIKSNNTNFEMDSLKKLSNQKQLIAKKHYGFWQCMDTLREKNILEKLYKKNKNPWIFKKHLIS